jgi:hypothetical protein
VAPPPGIRGRRVYTGRNVTAYFDLDRDGIAELAMNPVLMGSVIACAEGEAKPYAVSISPRSNRQHKHYADSFTVVPGAVMIRRMRRAAAHLINDAPHAAFVEWGNDGFEGHRVLGRTLDHLNRPRSE